MTWHPKEEQLRFHAARALEDAYANRERPRCSRDDFSDGFLAALRWLQSRSSFVDGTWPDSTDATAARATGGGEGER